MRSRLLAVAALLPRVLALVSLVLGLVVTADPCPSASGGGC